MVIGDACFCCGRYDGLTSGGCTYCGVKTFCASCSELLSCGCGRYADGHACPSSQIVATIVPIPTVFEPAIVVDRSDRLAR